MRSRHLIALASVAVLAAGCGGAPPEVQAPKTEESAPEVARPKRSGISMQSEVGALDEKQATKAFEKASQKMSACFARGVQRVPYLSGAVSFYVRVGGDGQARYTYLRDSTLGDRATEECMLASLKAITWPTPEGGQEGEAKNEFQFDPGGDERPPVAWSPEQLGPPFQKARGELSQCRKRAGTGPVKATFYVEPDGKPLTIGASTSDEKGDAAIACIVDRLKGITFPSPGSYASKVSVVID